MAGGFLGDHWLVDRLIGGAAGWGSLALIGWGYRRLRGFDGLGQGDAKLLGAIGLWLGWSVLPIVLLLSTSFGLGLALIRRRAVPLAEQRIPLGTALGLSAMLVGLIAPAL